MAATVGIVSIGEMGYGIARLLVAHNFKILTNVQGRSANTESRARDAQLTLVPTDRDLVTRSDYILSIVPPRDAEATARRMAAEVAAARQTATHPLYYLDLNAISPASVRAIGALFASSETSVRFVDGGIIGGPPQPGAAATSSSSSAAAAAAAGGSSTWTRPSVPLSGPFPLAEAPVAGARLADALNTRHLGPGVGTASGLKACFAALSKGLTGLAIQSFSTAEQLGVRGELQEHLRMHSPRTAEMVERGLVGMVPKAYRWVAEMERIGETFEEDGGWGEKARVFEGIAEVYRMVAEESEVGKERRKGAELGNVVGSVVKGLRKEKEE
ncbi:6-phosphogluconate dehydrogenase [Lineolata rhizophorae]|uniref:6-phosphogluconate dehydrogenase n=1 Tax=Lineolata rhizophorae TaxID=578093 RepID=A0A6A6PDV2_9PEZI|nr:6-phosphogluconate dehydrogenase [Lineolata rhizophorae]